MGAGTHLRAGVESRAACAALRPVLVALAISLSAGPWFACSRPTPSRILPASGARGDGPLWRGTAIRDSQRKQAILRGLSWLGARLQRPRVFYLHAPDYLFGFDFLARAADDPVVRRGAWTRGRMLAREIRVILRRDLTPTCSDTVVQSALSNLHRVRNFGIEVRALVARLRRILAKRGVARVIGFRPGRDRPTYRQYLGGLFSAYYLRELGIASSVSLARLFALAPSFPLACRPELTPIVYRRRFYLATHLVYFANRYLRFRLPPGLLPRVHRFLTRCAARTFHTRNPELVGELVNVLRAWGRGYGDPRVREGVRILLGLQRPDGSWTSPADPSEYGLFHATLMAMSGLIHYRFRGEGPDDPELAKVLRRRRD